MVKRAKTYSRDQWARLTDDDKAALVHTANLGYRWCEQHKNWDFPWWTDESQADGYVHSIDLGWTCSCWLSSSGWPGVPGPVSFPLHKHSSAGYTNALFALLMAAAVFAVVILMRT